MYNNNDNKYIYGQFRDYSQSPEDHFNDQSAEPEMTTPQTDNTKPRKNKSSHSFGVRAIALCLACILIGGACGAGAGYLVYDNLSSKNTSVSDSSSSKNEVVLGSSSTPNLVTSNVTSATEGELDAQSIYSLYCQSTVGITSSITTTNVFGQTSQGSVSGSGFIISSDGYIATNYHVVETANEYGVDINVVMYDGTSYVAELVGYDKSNDVAVLKIDADGLTPVTLGNSNDISVGDTVYALGNPLGELTYTFTSGMISALDREIQTDTNTKINMFQMDAAVNSGNSGGPAINSKGEVIGIVTAKYATTGVEGLGFAIPINDALSIIEDIISNGYVTGKAYMGINAVTVSSSVAQYYNMVEGVYVYSVETGSCAEKAGLISGDIIVAVDNYDTTTVSDLNTAKRYYSAGDTAVLKVYRNSEYITLSITFDEENPNTASSGSSSQEDSSQSRQPVQGGNSGGFQPNVYSNGSESYGY